jgi:FKBP-type peptidyl-prolyl cis-trans isomerase FkpA
MPRSTVRRICLLSVALVAAAACTPASNDAAKPKTAQAHAPLTAVQVDSDKAKVSYIVGRDFARSIEPVRGELDTEVVLSAIRDAQAGRPSLFDEAQSKRIREGFSEHLRNKHDADTKALAARNLQTGEAFLKRNAQVQGVITTPSGLQYQVMRAGKGAHPKAGDTVRVNYLGRLLDGSKFESTYDTDHPAEFVLAQVMPGWTQGVQLMTPGSQYRFWIPAKLAYGERGMAGQIEPNSVLVFEIELLEIAGEGVPVHDE